MRYRPDIDGLRAVAVLAVLLFHAGVAPFGGGYVGVDVFFVISGFLITRLIHDQVAEGRFTFANFYIRRVRRLFPALLATLCVCFVVAFLIFSPPDFAKFADSLVFAIFSVSNIYFWDQSGYFDSASHMKPLLHSWSLSVEEQFYLVWPAVLVMLLRLRVRGLAPAAVIVGMAASLALNDVFGDGFTRFFGTTFADGPTTIFFLAPFRVFEFGIGAILVWLLPYRPTQGLWLEPLLPLGLAMIGTAAVTYSESTLFPSYNALLPCLGAALAIYGGTARYSSRLLSNRPMVWLGLISYSLYLVHWPVIVFYHAYSFADFGAVDRVAVCVLSLGLAVVLHYAVERPLRSGRIGGRRVPARWAIAAIGAPAALVVGLSVAVWAGEGWSWRFPPAIADKIADPKAFQAFNKALAVRLDAPFAEDGRRRVLVVGDSQANDFVNLLHAAGVDQSFDLRVHMIDAQCQPLYGVPPKLFVGNIGGKMRGSCLEQLHRLNADARIAAADTVVLAANWRPWSGALVPEAVSNLKNRGIRQVVVLGPKRQGMSGPDLVLRECLHQKDESRHFAFARLPEPIVAVNSFLKANQGPYGFIDLYDTLCSAQAGCDYLTREGQVIFFDYVHLTPEGARHVAARLRAVGAFLPLADGESVVRKELP